MRTTRLLFYAIPVLFAAGLVSIAFDISPQHAVHSTKPVVQSVRLADSSQAQPAPPPPNQNLPPGAIKHPGEKCATTVQPPDYQSCPHPDDLHCRGTPRQIGQCMS